MFIDPQEQREATRQLPRLMVEGLFKAGTGLGVLALIFEIAADAFSVAAYQTLLAIHGAGGRHEVAFAAFSVLSIMLYLGVVPAYKGAAYLRPDSGGSGPLVEAAGPDWLRPLSWIGTSLFFLDAVFTIIISSISAADGLMLLLPEFSAYRVLMAEFFAFFIMAVLVLMGPQRAVPIFLIGGAAFTIFTLFALGYVGVNAVIDADKHEEVQAIICRLVKEEVITATEHGEVTEVDLHDENENATAYRCATEAEITAGEAIDPGVALAIPEEEVITPEEVEEFNETFNTLFAVSDEIFILLFFSSMSSAMLGFSGYEVIPASGKHAARPKWKVINTALTIAAIFLIGTGLIQLLSAWRWGIPATEGYSTLLIEYELVFGDTALLTLAGVLLAVILLLAQGGGYVGGSAVAANAARLGRMPGFFKDDRFGVAAIWLVSAMTIPLIPSVTLVEAYYAFGFVSAFVITSTTVVFVRKKILLEKGIQPGSREHRSLRFAGIRGMIASYIMMAVLIWQKFDALLFIIPAAAAITLFQLYIYRGGVKQPDITETVPALKPALKGKRVDYDSGFQRAHDEARQRGVVDLVKDLQAEGALNKFNVPPERVYRLISYTHQVDPDLWTPDPFHAHDDEEHTPEPSEILEQIYHAAYEQRESVLATIEAHSHYGIFTYIHKYAHNWISENRSESVVEEQMISILFPHTNKESIMEEYRGFEWQILPEAIWQFSRMRYEWAKTQWTNISDRLTTIWTLQDVGLLSGDIDAEDLAKRIRQAGEAKFDGNSMTNSPPPE